MAYKQIYSPLYDKKKWMALIFIKNLALALQQQLFGLKVIAYIESRAFAATRMTRQTWQVHNSLYKRLLLHDSNFHTRYNRS